VRAIPAVHRLAARVLRGAALGAAAVLLAMPATAQRLPPSASDLASLREAGAGTFRWFGFHIYDARLWVEGEGFAPDRAFALGLRYAREFKGTAIAQSSTDEIRRLQLADESRIVRWDAEMRRIFPTVRPGDEIVGLHRPSRGVEFFHNGAPIGEIADPSFARAFFGIWLDPRTKGPELRLALLGGGSR
jgi:hypothetical protein